MSDAVELSATEWHVLRMVVFERDGWRCLAPVLDPNAGTCVNKWGENFDGQWHYPDRPANIGRYLTLQHIWPFVGSVKGKKPPDAVEYLLTLCWGHHVRGIPGTGGAIWGTNSDNLEKQRKYLRDRYSQLEAERMNHGPRKAMGFGVDTDATLSADDADGLPRRGEE